ncbi:MAG TPA: hypothetical protein VMP11_01765 [Verrucomicrobiae bacterium]|nr:hypothetical protein [Verrucomicrobiae bacterium]
MNEASSNQTGVASPQKSRLAVVSFVLCILGFAYVFILPLVNGTREEAHLALCLRNMQQIGLAIGLYANEHDGNIPRTFTDLQPYATNLDKLLICPSAKDKTHPSYQIVFGGEKWERWSTKDNAINDLVVAESTNDHRSGSNALYNDGHVAWVSALVETNRP